eukprot:12906492-Prorocentrum_lima.AAC.1
MLSRVGGAARVLAALVGGAKALVGQLAAVGLPIARKKTRVMASQAALRRALQLRLAGSTGAIAARMERNLGSDFASGR